MATATSWTDVYAIFKAYPNVVRVNQDEGCFDASDNKIDAVSYTHLRAHET